MYIYIYIHLFIYLFIYLYRERESVCVFKMTNPMAQHSKVFRSLYRRFGFKELSGTVRKLQFSAPYYDVLTYVLNKV